MLSTRQRAIINFDDFHVGRVFDFTASRQQAAHGFCEFHFYAVCCWKFFHMAFVCADTSLTIKPNDACEIPVANNKRSNNNTTLRETKKNYKNKMENDNDIISHGKQKLKSHSRSSVIVAFMSVSRPFPFPLIWLATFTWL